MDTWRIKMLTYIMAVSLNIRSVTNEALQQNLDLHLKLFASFVLTRISKNFVLLVANFCIIPVFSSQDYAMSTNHSYLANWNLHLMQIPISHPMLKKYDIKRFTSSKLLGNSTFTTKDCINE